jgi:Flp pilus assembly protein protease CpaA
MIDLIKHSIALFYLLTGSISDLKTREVSDWSNYGLISIGIASNLIFSLSSKNYDYIINSLIGLGVFWILALIMYYTGQWGGGDSKMLMGLGALYGIGLNFLEPQFLIAFLINSLIAGAIYGIIWSFSLAVIKWKKFYKEYNKNINEKKILLIRKIILAIIGILLVLTFFSSKPEFKLMYFSLGIITFLTFHIGIIIKAVEKACMHKPITPDLLTEGDWLVKDVKYKGKVICEKSNIGIEKKEIKKLIRMYKQKKIKKVLVKEGIPFVPSFLFGWILTILYGNLFMIII